MSARWAAGLRRKGLVASLVALALAMSLSGVARAAVKAAPGPSIATRTVKAVLIYPWAGCVTSSAWTTLAQDSSLYGTTQLRIDGTTFCSTSNQVTYAALVATKAKVLVFSDTAGGEYQLTPAEIAAITQYVQAGHNIVATYATFLYSSYDNSALAPLFGLASSFSATPAFVTPYYKILRTSAPLFSAVPNPYDSNGYASTQSPAGGHWNKAALAGAKYGALASGGRAAITMFDDTADHYQAVYISNMPEYSPDTADNQFLYNALTLRS